MTDSTSNPEERTAPEVPDSLDDEELADIVQQLAEDVVHLENQIGEMREDTVRPRTVQVVLEEYGLSTAKATEMVEMVETVEAKGRGDAADDDDK